MRRFRLFALALTLTILVFSGLGGCAAGGDEFGEGGQGSPDTGTAGHADGSGTADTGTDTGHEATDNDTGSMDAPADGKAGEGGKSGTYTIGGTVTGLVGSGLVLEDNGSDNLSITKDGAFTFAVPIATGSTYAVTAFIQPESPAQECVVSSGSGTVGTSNVTGVVVNCAAETYTIGGKISGLSGTVVLQDNGGDDLTVTADGSFTFATPVAMGGAYKVTVHTQPAVPSQKCVVTDGGGVVASSNVTSVVVKCTTNKFTVGGMVTGLAGSGLVLQNNGSDDLPIASNGAFTFATSIASGSSYLVSVSTEPSLPTQICMVTLGSGTVTNKDITTVNVACTTSSFTIGGNVSGLALGDSVVLQDNLTDNLTVTTNGGFTFATALASGAAYSATVLTQPSTPTAETCVITMGSGSVLGSNVTSIVVTCTAPAGGCGRFTSGYTGAWSTVAVNPFTTSMGMSGYIPAGGTPTIFLSYSTSFDEYLTSTNSYTPLAASPVAFPGYGSTAWQGNAIWAVTAGDVIKYDITAGTWSTVATGLTTDTDNQTASDASGNLWSYASEGVVLQYNIASGATLEYTLPTALGGSEPRIVFDDCTGLLYLTDFATYPLYSYDPTTGIQTSLSELPGSNIFQDGFCGDESGHLFAVTETPTAYQYTIATDTWVALPAGGVSGSVFSACGVGADGYLYATDPGVSSAMYRIQLN